MLQKIGEIEAGSQGRIDDAQQIVAPDQFVQGAKAERGHDLAHVLRNVAQVDYDLVHGADKMLA